MKTLNSRLGLVLAITSLVAGCVTRNAGVGGDGDGSGEETSSASASESGADGGSGGSGDGSGSASQSSSGSSGSGSATSATTGPACAAWSESCVELECCDPMDYCHPSSQVCLQNDDTGGGSFLDGNWGDFGGTDIECDVWAQDCPDLEKCSAWANDGGNAWNATKCSPINPDPDAPGQPCVVEGNAVSGVDSCELGAMCFYVEEASNRGTCVGLCRGDPANPVCAQPGTECAIFNDGVLNLCLETCDPLLQTCPMGQMCVPKQVDIGFVCLAQWASTGVGDPCEFINACSAGQACVAADKVPGCPGGSAGCCTEFCDVSAPVCSDPMASCSSWWADPGDAISGLEDLGVCVLP